MCCFRNSLYFFYFLHWFRMRVESKCNPLLLPLACKATLVFWYFTSCYESRLLFVLYISVKQTIYLKTCISSIAPQYIRFYSLGLGAICEANLKIGVELSIVFLTLQKRGVKETWEGKKASRLMREGGNGEPRTLLSRRLTRWLANVFLNWRNKKGDRLLL